jgi:hypothetical protein
MLDRKPGLIEIRLNSASQLFNSFDPSPFQERDLDDNAEEFIVGWAREFPDREKLRIVVHLPKDQCDREGATLPAAVTQHFEYRASVMRRELSETFRSGRRYLLVGLSIFAACHLAAEVLANTFPDDTFVEGIVQGLIIIGWVANWRPFELLIYDWWPLRRRIRLYERLAKADITLAVR